MKPNIADQSCTNAPHSSPPLSPRWTHCRGREFENASRRTRSGAGFLVMISLLCAAAASHAQQPPAMKDLDGVRILTIQPYQLLLGPLSRSTCDAEMAPYCEIVITSVTYGGRDYCVALAPNVTVKTQNGGGGNKKKITWKLNTTSLKTKPVAFHPDSGIIISVDAQSQVDIKGSPGATSDLYSTKTRRDTKDAYAVYLPVILWGQSGSEELCAAIDPRITNN